MGILVLFLADLPPVECALRSTWLEEAAVALRVHWGRRPLFYFGCCRLLGVEELGHIFARLRK